MHRVNLVIHVAIGSLIGIGQPLYSGFTPKSNRQFRAALAAMPALAQAAPTSAGVYRVGAGVTPPSIISKTEPRYTDEARRLHMNAIVVLSLIVGDDGLARDIKLWRAVGVGLDEEAIETVKT